jgi:hypothetical protein
MNHHPDDDMLLDLVLDLLPREREEQVLDHVAHCRACESMMRRLGREKERLAPPPSSAFLPHAATPGDARQEAFTSSIRRWIGGPWTIRRLLPMAGFVAGLALVVIFLIPRGPMSRSQIEANWLPAPPVLLQRGGLKDNAMSGRLAAGLAAYNRRDLPSAIRNLQEATVSPELESFRSIYLASALTMSGEYPQAIRLLRKQTPDFLPDPWDTEVHWTLLVAFERAGRRASADSLRRILAAHPGEIGDRVRRLH